MMLLYGIKVIQKYKTMLLKCSISTLELTMLARGHYGVALHHDLIMIFNIGFLGLKFKIFIGGIIPSWISVVIHSAVLVFCWCGINGRILSGSVIIRHTVIFQRLSFPANVSKIVQHRNEFTTGILFLIYYFLSGYGQVSHQ